MDVTVLYQEMVCTKLYTNNYNGINHEIDDFHRSCGLCGQEAAREIGQKHGAQPFIFGS